MNTYKETVLRYRVLRHEELPEAHKAEYRRHGMDPDDTWSLIYSFTTLEAAQDTMKDLQAAAPRTWTYRLVDAGQAEVLDRVAW